MKEGSAIAKVPALRLAFLRAVESYHPEQERLFNDRFSRGLMPGLWKVFLLPGLRHALVALTEQVGPGFVGSLYCRTRYIDDMLCDALGAGIAQVVILGAGFDARAYRITNIERVHVFELDLPSTQRLKQTFVEKVVGKLPAHVSFVPIDFDRQDIEDVMTAAGFRKGLKSFFIWEGVTQYLAAEAVDRTFRYMCGAAAGGSEIVFTYIHQGIIDGTARSKADQKLVSSAHRGGTPWIFGLAPSGLAEYLTQRGLELVEEVWAPDFRTRYLKPRGRQINIFEGERVVLARIVSAVKRGVGSEANYQKV
ncbi:MAG TPA: class I SAM-dependent methyltransferase [Desulfatiglandales bacterium]|nr:class I SAM-dependent methyltransferase [Desulfatiglandales bacterium]